MILATITIDFERVNCSVYESQMTFFPDQGKVKLGSGYMYMSTNRYIDICTFLLLLRKCEAWRITREG